MPGASLSAPMLMSPPPMPSVPAAIVIADLRVDYGDFVVHVFQESVREFYNFDQLWGTAPEVPVPEE